MKNKGCWIAGCAGTAIVAVVLLVIGLGLGFYFYKQGRASEVPEAPLAEMPPLPTSAHLSDVDKVEMVGNTLQGFQAGVRAGTFRGFYERYFSDLWKGQISAEDFDKVFGRFLSAKIELEPAAFKTAPTFTRDVLDGQGVWHAAGSYLVRNVNGGEQVNWEFAYIHEARGWGLIEVNVHAAPPAMLH